MATEKRLIDANAFLDEALKRYTDRERGRDLLYTACEVKQNLADMICEAPTVDAVEVVHSRFVRIADFGDGEGCFGHCEKCGTVHHSQSPVALKADHRWCRRCGAKMDGDGNG